MVVVVDRPRYPLPRGDVGGVAVVPPNTEPKRTQRYSGMAKARRAIASAGPGRSGRNHRRGPGRGLADLAPATTKYNDRTTCQPDLPANADTRPPIVISPGRIESRVVMIEVPTIYAIPRTFWSSTDRQSDLPGVRHRSGQRHNPAEGPDRATLSVSMYAGRNAADEPEVSAKDQMADMLRQAT